MTFTHCGREYTLCILQQSYWTPASKGLIRKILSNAIQPRMANLSNIRLQSHDKPFSNTDVDYFRPIQAKTSRKTRRNQGTLKTYGVILTYIYIYKYMSIITHIYIYIYIYI